VEILFTRTRQSLLSSQELQQFRIRCPTIPLVLATKARSGYPSGSTDGPLHLPPVLNKNDARRPQRATPSASPAMLPPPAGNTRAHQVAMWRTLLCIGRTALTRDNKSIFAKNKGQTGTHNSPEDRENQVSPTTTTGDRRWKRTQERTGPHNNLVSEEPADPRETSRAESTVLTMSAENIHGKRWTPDTTPDKSEKKGPCQRTIGENKEREKL